MVLKPKEDLGRLIFEVPRSHTHTHTHTHKESLERVINWSQRQLPAQHTTNNGRTSMSSFEPAIPVIQRPQTFALDRTAAGIRNDIRTNYIYIFKFILSLIVGFLGKCLHCFYVILMLSLMTVCGPKRVQL